MIAKMGDKLLYEVPQEEVVFKYNDDDKLSKDNENDASEDKPQKVQAQNKFVVDMDKDRPQWFSKALLKKKDKWYKWDYTLYIMSRDLPKSFKDGASPTLNWSAPSLNS